MKLRPDLQKLLSYNLDVLGQGLQVIDAYAAAPGCDFSRHAGPHLRHIIEHYEAFTQHVEEHSVDYDSRDRDRRVEVDPELARARLTATQRALSSLDLVALADHPIAVQMRVGLMGEDNFVSFSSLSRELLFLAAHAVHHYALIQIHGLSQGVSLGADFGKAPATLRHAHHG